MAATEQVILVDENDQPIGTTEKIQAHEEGLCHRAFSVFVFRDEFGSELLLQQRAKEKYHSPNLWTNTCCSHPRPGENTLLAAERRLKEELGISVGLQAIGQFHYIAHFNNGLIENEVDHVLIGTLANQEIIPNSSEVQACRWVTLTDLKTELGAYPEHFTPWFKQALDIVSDYLNK